ncbi:hypothetical protein GGI05_001798, partial [Coemansia sp. RSA 2603]
FKPICDALKAPRKDHEDILAGKEDEYKQASQTAHLIAVAKASGGKGSSGGSNNNSGWKKQGFRKGWKGNGKKPFQKGGSSKPAKPSGDSAASQQ